MTSHTTATEEETMTSWIFEPGHTEAAFRARQ